MKDYAEHEERNKTMEHISKEQLRVIYRGKWVYLGFRLEPFANPDSFYTRCPFCGHEERQNRLCLRVCRACGAELELEMPCEGEMKDAEE